jgi:ABC-type transport system involved in cytochrome bd biosynthesis fused ATPase/permease subunit
MEADNYSEKGATTWDKVNKRIYFEGFKPYPFLLFCGGSAILILLMFVMWGFVGIIVAFIVVIPVWIFFQNVKAENKKGRVDYLREVIMDRRLPEYIKDDGVLYQFGKSDKKRSINETG